MGAVVLSYNLGSSRKIAYIMTELRMFPSQINGNTTVILIPECLEVEVLPVSFYISSGGGPCTGELVVQLVLKLARQTALAMEYTVRQKIKNNFIQVMEYFP